MWAPEGDAVLLWQVEAWVEQLPPYAAAVENRDELERLQREIERLCEENARLLRMHETLLTARATDQLIVPVLEEQLHTTSQQRDFFQVRFAEMALRVRDSREDNRRESATCDRMMETLGDLPRQLREGWR